MHPLDLFDRFRRWFGWALPGRQPWDRKPWQVAPERPDDWLLEPRVWKRPVCCFRNWMKSGPCFATSNSAWKCGSVTDVVSDCELASLR